MTRQGEPVQRVREVHGAYGGDADPESPAGLQVSLDHQTIIMCTSNFLSVHSDPESPAEFYVSHDHFTSK